jgi:hypothetical protein
MNFVALNKKGVCSYCKKIFEVGFEVDLDRRFVSSPKICEKCAKNLYMALGQKLIPKSPRNINFGFKILKEKEFN